jgi:hypothetical protein
METARIPIMNRAVRFMGTSVRPLTGAVPGRVRLRAY